MTNCTFKFKDRNGLITTEELQDQTKLARSVLQAWTTVETWSR